MGYTDVLVTSDMSSSGVVCNKGPTTCIFLKVMRPVTTKAAVMACKEAEMQVRSDASLGFTQCKFFLQAVSPRTSCKRRPELTVLMTHHIQRKSHALILRR